MKISNKKILNLKVFKVKNLSVFEIPKETELQLFATI